MRNLFIGPAGLRAGWGIAIFVAMLALCVLVGMRLFPRILNLPSVITPGPVMLRDAIGSLLVLMLTCVMALIERRPIGSYGLTGPRPLRNFATGLGWGVALFSALIGMLVATGHLVFAGTALQGGAIAAYGVAWLVVFFLVAFSEETLFRGYLQSTLARGIGFWPAAVFLSLCFGLIHLRSENEIALGIAMAVMGGLVFCLGLRLSGSLWWGIGFHAAWDWAESFLFGTPDSGYLVQGHWMDSRPVGDVHWSGGTAGPEGSLLAIPVFLVAAAVIALTLRRRTT